MMVEDMIARRLVLRAVPKRIISLIPSVTELLFDLGVGENVVGITDYCIHPSGGLANLKRIGGTKNPDIEKIKLLNPDIIIADKNENTRRRVEALMNVAPVYVIEVNNYQDALDMILRLAHIFQKEKRGQAMLMEIESCFGSLRFGRSKKKVFFPIWKNPCMSINKDTFIHSMIDKMGLVNVCAERERHYPIVKEAELEALNPDYVFLPSEPCSYTSEDLKDCKKLFPQAKVIRVDGQMFAWYGSRLLYAGKYFDDLYQNILASPET